MPPQTRWLLGAAFALAAALVFTPLVRYLARRRGMVSRPRGDRWSKKPTALLGGVAIFAAFLPPALVALPDVPFAPVVLAGSVVLFWLGLLDDVRDLKPYQKLIGQIIGSSVVILGGLTLPWTPWPLVNMAITMFWLVGVTNAVNLLDNMDGLATGVSAIAAAVMATSFFLNDEWAAGGLVAAFAAALVGFLVYNFNPASIFMGDCGSMFIGFFLASAALMNVSGGRVTGLFPVLAVPALLLFIPIFDTTLVTVLRKLAGRAVSQGGRDHTSHRLVALGLSEKKAVGLLYLLAAVSGLTALLVRRVSIDLGLAVIAGFTVALTLLGIHLAKVKVYPDGEARPADERVVVGFLVNLSHKRRVFEVLLDVVLIGLAYYAATLLYYGSPLPAPAVAVLLQSLPVLVILKLVAFLVFGVYRGLWRYVSVHDLLAYGKAVAAGSVASILVFLFLNRLEGLSRVVLVLDATLLLLLLSGSRVGFLVLRRLLPARHGHGGRRTLIYGAGDGGELLLREMRNNHALRCEAVGFADDDPLKKGRVIHGLRVFGGNGSLLSICREQRIEMVVISSEKIAEERVLEILRDCQRAEIRLKKMRIVFEEVESEAGDEAVPE